MIDISPTLRLHDDEVTIDYVRSPGPGGQNVNKVATAAQLRFRLAGSSLPSPVRERLAHLERKRINRLGVLTLVAHTHRTQEANRREVLRKLAAVIQRAVRPPRPRVATKPSRAAREKRLRAKKLRSQLKDARSSRRGTRGQES
ncbi:MAG: alternative ribosome rescue aminoacyl-tRNA hydrolase ArfB [Chloroflexi bacterium]|nr:alternative ribosome rescue aminoacyl-tRNA hydrolase ArfB [Chloroflexota bacterium]